MIRIYGQDLDALRAKAEEVHQILTEIDGVVKENIGLQIKEPQIEVEVDLAKAKEYGIKPGDVRRAVAALVASEEVGDLYYGGKVYDVRVIGVPASRNSVSSIEALPIDTPSGDKVLLGDVADI